MSLVINYNKTRQSKITTSFVFRDRFNEISTSTYVSELHSTTHPCINGQEQSATTPFPAAVATAAHSSQIKPSNSTSSLVRVWHTQHASMKVALLKMMFRFGPFSPNNMTARGATLLCCSLFLAVSVNNTQRIVCGGLEKHLP